MNREARIAERVAANATKDEQSEMRYVTAELRRLVGKVDWLKAEARRYAFEDREAAKTALGLSNVSGVISHALDMLGEIYQMGYFSGGKTAKTRELTAMMEVEAPLDERFEYWLLNRIHGHEIETIDRVVFGFYQEPFLRVYATTKEGSKVRYVLSFSDFHQRQASRQRQAVGRDQMRDVVYAIEDAADALEKAVKVAEQNGYTVKMEALKRAYRDIEAVGREVARGQYP